jgi:hypothetical protein
MAKIPSDKLFRLVKSLTGHEKRYFKVFAHSFQQSDALYMHLFDLIDTAQVFDDTMFQKKLYGKQGLATKKYPVLKAYLYDLVLKSLQLYDDKNSVIYKLNTLLQSVAVLYKRGLYADCEPILKKAEKLALTYESYSYVLEVLDWRKQLAYTRADIDFLDKELKQIHRTEQQVLTLQQDILRSKQAFFNVLLQVRRDAQGIAQLSREKTELVPAMAEEPLVSVRSSILTLRTQNLKHYAKQELELFQSTGAQLIAYIEQFPYFSRENLTDYIAALSNYILACGILNRYDEVEKTLEKLRNLIPNSLDDRMKIHRQYYSNRFAMCVFTGEFEMGKALITDHKRELAELGIPRYESDSTLIQYFLLYFGNADYDQALDHLNDWMNQPRSVGRLDLQSLVRMLNLIVHYEQGNLILLEYKLRGTTRYMRSRKQEFNLEKLFIGLISDLTKLGSESERRKRCAETKKELQLIQDQASVRTILKTFDFDAWLDAKISGNSFEKVVKDKYLNLAASLRNN